MLATDLDITCCPCRRKRPLVSLADGKLACSDGSCAMSDAEMGFPQIENTSVLIPFEEEETLCERASYETQAKNPYVSRKKQGGLKDKLKRIFIADTKITEANIQRLLAETAPSGRVLVIGSGTKGLGLEALYQQDQFPLIGIDVYGSPSVDIIADAHFLPFVEDSFDAVVIQAVLEHVLIPRDVVKEIERVLKPGGLVYAETPFMQQVHEGAYDFARFSVTGHRMLFHRFEAIDFGPLHGPGTALAWSWKYFAWAITGSRLVSQIVYLPLKILGSVMDRALSRRRKWDGAASGFFLGRLTPENEPRSYVCQLKISYDGMQP